ncbi:MAG: tetratricopeptide repeat protein [Patescibacteria group bacterium]|nr:tetratricopeptide repeat protein [Patescibacteria group bacterium]
MITGFFTSLTTKKAISIIILIGILVFSNGLFNNFIGDDSSQIIDNVNVHSIINIFSFFSGSTFYNGAQQGLVGIYYKPILSTFFSIIYTLFGPNYSAFHFFQIALHIINACILYLLFKRFFKNSLALILSLIFLTHPINSEAVFYIASMQDVLFFFFGVLALWMIESFQSSKVFLLANFSLFLSLLSKETGILFLFTLIIYMFMFKKKYRYSQLGYSIIILCTYLVLRIHAVGTLTNPVGPIGSVNLFERILNMPAILSYYIKIFVFPLNLTAFNSWVSPQVNLNSFIFPLMIDILLLSIIIGFGFVLYKKYFRQYFTFYLFFAIWFLLGIVMHLQIFPLDTTVAERWFYFPIVGILGMLGILLEIFYFDTKNKWSLIAIITILVLLSTRTFVRSFDWRNQLILATHDIKLSPNDYNLEAIMSTELINQKRYKEALVYAERSVKLYPYLGGYNNLGVIYLHLGKYQKSKEAFLQALKYGDYIYIYDNIANLSLIYGNYNENKEFVKKALNKFPQDYRLWTDLALLEYEANNFNSAKEAINQAYHYDQSTRTVFLYNKIMNNGH